MLLPKFSKFQGLLTEKYYGPLTFLDEVMKVKIEERFFPFVPAEGPFMNSSLVIDGTDCPIDRASRREDRNLYSNGRHKENT